MRHRTNLVRTPAARHFMGFGIVLLALALMGCQTPASTWQPVSRECTEEKTVSAEIVALEQAYVLNRFGAYVPAGMMYALKRDVVPLDPSKGDAGPGNARLRSDKRPRPLVLRVHAGSCLRVTLHNWLTPQRDNAPTEPQEPSLQSGARRVAAGPAHMTDPAGSKPTSRALKPLRPVAENHAMRTRSVSFHATGLEATRPARCPAGAVCGGDGTYIGLDGQQAVFTHDGRAPSVSGYRSGSVIAPGQVSVTQWIARAEGSYFAHSMAAPVSGEGDGGQIGLGLFAAVNVEPRDSQWFRSQVSQAELDAAAQPAQGGDRHPYAQLAYGRFAILDKREIVHSDVNAIIVRSEQERQRCTLRHQGAMADGQRCEPAFREFTVILHDEVHAVQAFPELADPENPLHFIKDGMGINYGVSGMGSAAFAAMPQRGVGPAASCAECRAEEFFLSSWANGDPALVLQWSADGKRPIGARYPDDPSNVHHSYLGDPVVFRNLHAGPKETHVFHLHAHQWVLDASDPNSTYLDSQTIAPGASFSYGIEFGGSGNRNFTPGDSIFHCHLYPHFAQGMWELWRVHDAFANGLHRGKFDVSRPVGPDNDPRSRSLPDGEVPEGIASPAIVPLPGLALAPMPSADFRGYPFYIPGQEGRRPPQPALDFDVVAGATPYTDMKNEPPAQSTIVDGGLPRHVVKKGEVAMLNALPRDSATARRIVEHSLAKGGDAAQVIARKVYEDFPAALVALAGEWETAELKLLPHSGTAEEKAAMTFHEGTLQVARPLVEGGLRPAPPGDSAWWTGGAAYETDFAAVLPEMARPAGPALFRVNGRGRQPGAPYANPCPASAPQREYRAAFIQTELTVNRHGWFDPQGRLVVLEDDIADVIDASRRTKLPEPLFFRANSGDCIQFKSTNLVPSALNADDFQIFTPTDTIGQHIHLVKFDVTSSDGSGNGWNYEDGSFSPDEVRERIFAYNKTVPPGQRLTPRTHPLFQPGGSLAAVPGLGTKGQCPPQGALPDEAYKAKLDKDHPFCGAQRTTQRWWADPILVRSGATAGKDNTLRTVFTHDHFGASSHQQHGLYAALVIEPANSVWTRLTATSSAAQLKAAGELQAAQGSLACDRVQSPGQVRSPLCDTLLGGADLSVRTDPLLRREGSSLVKDLEPRGPLKLRTDGGPTAPYANIIAPACIRDGDSHPWQPASGRNRPADGRVGEALCEPGSRTAQTRREFGLAFADFAQVYDLALEPVNTEFRSLASPGPNSRPRDASDRRTGKRQITPYRSRPIVIASEDPGTQLINYRHEPLALRIAAVLHDPVLGGFHYEQSRRRANGEPCRAGDTDCLGDMANAFASLVHESRDRALATQSYVQWLGSQGPGPAPRTEADLLSLRWRQLFGAGADTRPAQVARAAEQWRQQFNCALYDNEQWRPAAVGEGTAGAGTGSPVLEASAAGPWRRLDTTEFVRFCAERAARARAGGPLAVAEPGRVFGDPATPVLAVNEGDPVQIRLIQGAQEAQHVFAMTGMKWLRMPDSANSGWVNAQPLGISEHFEFDVRVPAFDSRMADYLYFSSSIDQLWDGMWGLMRAHCDFRAPNHACPPDSTLQPPPARIAALPTAAPAPKPATVQASHTRVCTEGVDSSAKIDVRSFEVSAVRACDLLGNCDGALAGHVYNRRFGIHDPQGLVYVMDDPAAPQSCQRTAGQLVTQDCLGAPGREPSRSLDQIAAPYRSGQRKLEPLVLRAAAGECVTLRLNNRLPPAAAHANQPPADERRPFNHLPMITDGFNLNQFGMSHSVGLSVPRLASNPATSDGANIGLNATASIRGGNGNLALPCGLGRPCQAHYAWSATDLQGPAGTRRSRPVEFGAVPLMAFGDAVKHAVHGLVGALVVGPQDSAVCAAQANESDRTSAPICRGQSLQYTDHVLVLHDAISAQRDGRGVPDLGAAEEPDDYGMKGINYRSEPLWARKGGEPADRDTAPCREAEARGQERPGCKPFSSRDVTQDFTDAFASTRGDPETPVIRARVGDRLRLHFVHSGGHTRQQGITIAGHGFRPYPFVNSSSEIDGFHCDRPPTQGSGVAGCNLWQGVFNGFGPMMAISLGLEAGGAGRMAKDYLIRTTGSFQLDGGTWGILRVVDEQAAAR